LNRKSLVSGIAEDLFTEIVFVMRKGEDEEMQV